jgi:hydroxymethylpyrimidine/phosphomethylpyrimidine kinase
MRIALTIAGSDSSGGAGIQADLKTFHQFGVFGASVITAITAQNTRGVQSWAATDEALVRAQIESVLGDMRPHAMKSGMLPNARIIKLVADAITDHALEHYVLDPVMISTSGDFLTDNSWLASIRDRLLPLAELLTPNSEEAAALLGTQIRTLDDSRAAAVALVRELGARAALVTGGHLRETEDIVDVLFDGKITEFTHPRIQTTGKHGTGCTLSAAITACLAKGESLRAAVKSATDFVHEAIRSAPNIGSGYGPVNHFVPVRTP